MARIHLSIEHPRTIVPDGRVSFRLGNAGEVPVKVTDGFTVERWDGRIWTEVDRDEQAGDRPTLATGERIDPLTWPDGPPDRRDLEPGWYRIGMSAQVRDSGGEADQELVVRARFEVRSSDWDGGPEDQRVGIVRHETSRGTAAAELVVEPREVAPDGEVSIRLANRGDVTLITGYGYEVQRWDDGAWVRHPKPEGGGGPSIAITLRPGEDSASHMRWPETWPHRSRDAMEDAMEPGWYRVVKRALTEEPGNDSTELVVSALFEVAP